MSVRPGISAILVIILAACASVVPLQTHPGALTGAGDVAVTRARLLYGLRADGHLVRGERPGAISATLYIHQGSAEVTVLYDQSSYRIDLERTYGLDQAEGANGAVISSRYHDGIARFDSRVRRAEQRLILRPPPASGLLTAATYEEVEASVVRALETTRYRIETSEQGRIVASRRLGRQGELRLAVLYEPGRFRVELVESESAIIDPNDTSLVFVDSAVVQQMTQVQAAINAAGGEVREEANDAEAERRRHEESLAYADQRRAEADRDRMALARLPATAPNPVGGQTGQPAPAAAGFSVVQEPNGLGAARVEIIHQGASPLHRLAFRSYGSREWRANQLSRTMQPGDSYTVNGIQPGTYELRVETLRGYKEWRPLRLGAGGVYRLVITTQGWFAL